MITTRCDCCKACSPDVSFSYKIKRPFSIKRFFTDSQGGSWEKMHICDECFNAFMIVMLKARNKHENFNCL